jgi:hypothetical protein
MRTRKHLAGEWECDERGGVISVAQQRQQNKTLTGWGKPAVVARRERCTLGGVTSQAVLASSNASAKESSPQRAMSGKQPENRIPSTQTISYRSACPAGAVVTRWSAMRKAKYVRDTMATSFSEAHADIPSERSGRRYDRTAYRGKLPRYRFVSDKRLVAHPRCSLGVIKPP